MNFAPCLDTTMCSSCEAELHEEELHAEHSSLCTECGDSLNAELSAKREAERIADCTCTDCGRVVASIDDLIDSANSGDYRCTECHEKHEYAMAELADERSRSDYYGGELDASVYERATRRAIRRAS